MCGMCRELSKVSVLPLHAIIRSVEQLPNETDKMALYTLNGIIEYHLPLLTHPHYSYKIQDPS